ncbi:MAG: response regulator transcription factor [Alphaproteobacteria bacterium]|nr:response regulator transcription factor [Alphaproteobacteria bacterium]
MAHQLLLIEDDERLAQMVVDYLEGAGFRVRHSTTGGGGLTLNEQHPFDAIILDLMLPDMDGLDVCRSIRSVSQTPILMLTARGEAMDRIVGLELGADDYLPKPFEPRELLARLKAILRRGAAVASGDGANDILKFGRLEIDRDAREVRLDGEAKSLTGHQYEMLRALAEHPGRVLSREQIMDLVRGENLEAFDRSIDVHISRIRQAIEEDPKEPRRIITVRGAGYVFAKAQE